MDFKTFCQQNLNENSILRQFPVKYALQFKNIQTLPVDLILVPEFSKLFFGLRLKFFLFQFSGILTKKSLIGRGLSFFGTS